MALPVATSGGEALEDGDLGRSAVVGDRGEFGDQMPALSVVLFVAISS